MEVESYAGVRSTAGYCNVQLLAVDTRSWGPNITLSGKARRVRDPRSDVIIGLMNNARKRTDSPRVDLAPGQELYEAVVEGASMPIAYFENGIRTDQGYESIDLNSLSGFQQRQ